MAEYNFFPTIAYIGEDGSWNQGCDVLVFDISELTAEQWEVVEYLSDSEKIIFALAVLNGEDEVVESYIQDFRQDF